MILDDIGSLPPPGYPTDKKEPVGWMGQYQKEAKVRQKAFNEASSPSDFVPGAQRFETLLPEASERVSGYVKKAVRAIAPSFVDAAIQAGDLANRADKNIANSPEFAGMQGAIAAQSPQSKVALRAVGIAGNALLAGEPESLAPEIYGKLNEAAKTGSKPVDWVVQQVSSAAGMYGSYALGGGEVMGPLKFGAAYAAPSALTKVATGQESPLTGLADIAIGAGEFYGFGKAGELSSFGKRALANVGIATGAGSVSKIAHGENPIPSLSELGGDVLTGLAFAVGGGHNAHDHATETGKIEPSEIAEHQGAIEGAAPSENAAEVRAFESAPDRRSDSNVQRGQVQQEAEVAQDVPRGTPEQIQEIQNEIPSQPIGRPDGGDTEAQREGVPDGVPPDGNDRAGDTEGPAARGEDFASNSGDESIRQGEAQATPGPVETGVEVPEQFKPKYQEHVVGDEIEATPFGEEPVRGVVADYLPDTKEYVLEDGRTFHESEVKPVVDEIRPEARAQTDQEIVDSLNPGSVREATLQYLAQGGKLSYEDAERDVFGSHLKPSEKRRNYLSRGDDGRSIDSFVHEHLDEIGVPVKDEVDARNEIHDIISSVNSSKHARELLVEDHKRFLDTKQTEDGLPIFAREGIEDDSFDFGANVKPPEPPTLARGEKEIIPEETFGVRKKIIDPLLKEMGLPTNFALADAFEHQHSRVVEDAVRERVANRDKGEQLVGELLKKPRALEDKDVAQLTLEGAERMKVRDAAAADVAEVKRKFDLGEATEAEHLMALEHARTADVKFQRLLEAVGKSKTATARGLASMQVVVRVLGDSEFEYANIKRDFETHVNKGAELTPEQEAEIKERLSTVTDAQREVRDAEERDREPERQAERDRMWSHMLNELTTSGREIQKASRTGKLKEWAKKTIAEEDAKLKAKYGRLGAAGNVDPIEFVKWASAQIVDKGIKTAEALAKLLRQAFGNIKVDAKEVFNKASEFVERNASRAAKGDAEDILAKSGGKITGRTIFKLAKLKYNAGVKAEDILASITKDLQGVQPGITEHKVQEIFTDYGKPRYPSKEQDDRAIRDLKRIKRLDLQIESLKKGEAPPKSGQQAGKPLEENIDKIRALEAERSQLLKKQNLKVVDPEKQLATRQATIKTRLKNISRDLDVEIAALEKGQRVSVHEIGSVEHDTETKNLQEQVRQKRGQRDAIRDALDVSEGKMTLSDQQRVKSALQSANRAADEYQKLLDQGSPEKTKNTPVPETAELKRAREIRDRLRDNYRAQRDLANPGRLEKLRQDARVKSVDRQLAKMQERRAKGQYLPEPKTPLAPSNETLAADLKLARAKEEFRSWVESEKDKHRTTYQRFWDAAIAARRGSLLTGPDPVGRIFGADLARHLISDPLYILASKVVPKGMRNAVGEESFNDWAYRNHVLLTEGLSDMVNIIRGKKSLMNDGNEFRTSSTDAYGKLGKVVIKAANIPPRIHQAEKAPLFVAHYRSAQKKLFKEAAERGEDVLAQPIRDRIEVESREIANEAIGQEANFASKFVNGIVRMSEGLAKDHPWLGNGLAHAVRIYVPFTRISFNIAKWGVESAVGVPLAGARMLKNREAIRTGMIDSKTARSITRQLALGSIGSLAVAYGFFDPDDVTGFYSKDNKDEEPDQFKSLGHVGSIILSHTPQGMAAQIGATIRRVHDHAIANGHEEIGAYAQGVFRAAMGVAERAPFVSVAGSVQKLIDGEPTSAVGRELTGLLVPPIVTRFARLIDNEQKYRKGQNIWQEVEKNIPFASKNVPVSEKKQKAGEHTSMRRSRRRGRRE